MLQPEVKPLLPHIDWPVQPQVQVDLDPDARRRVFETCRTPLYM